MFQWKAHLDAGSMGEAGDQSVVLRPGSLALGQSLCARIDFFIFRRWMSCDRQGRLESKGNYRSCMIKLAVSPKIIKYRDFPRHLHDKYILAAWHSHRSGGYFRRQMAALTLPPGCRYKGVDQSIHSLGSVNLLRPDGKRRLLRQVKQPNQGHPEPSRT